MEMKKLVEENYKIEPFCHFLVLVNLERTNRATGSITRSKLIFAELARYDKDKNSAPGMSKDMLWSDAYTELESVIAAISQDKPPRFNENGLTKMLQDCLRGTAKAVMLLSLPPCRGDELAKIADAR